ncbi:MAG: hypothetical protein RL757_919 [Bacteroidota bacterium]|jgi:uncharacterized protein (TIRG00374 family)
MATPDPIDNPAELSDEARNVLRSLRASRMILPIFLGLGMMMWIVLRNFDFQKLDEITWNARTLQWILAAAVLLVLRHIAFALRMKVLSQGHFSFWKCVELVLIFEFSLCITPTTVGGSAVSLFVLTQEKLSGARTAVIVLYKVVLDTLFFVGTFPLLFALLGPHVLSPDISHFFEITPSTGVFWSCYLGMTSYGLFLFYGLFINPLVIKKMLMFFTKIPFLTRFRPKMERLSDEILIASVEMKKMRWREHGLAFLATVTAWTCKFLLISCLIIGIDNPPMDFGRESLLYGRLQAMFIIMALSPTPGGAGIAEKIFYPFLHDFLKNVEVATIIAFIWRAMSYYAYLALGAVVVPNWIRKVLLKK